MTHELKENFISFAKALGLTDEHIIFPIHIGNHRLVTGEGYMGTAQA